MNYAEENEQLLRRIKAGDEAARKEMLHLNIALVRWQANEVLRQNSGPKPRPSYDDFLIVGLDGAWQGILSIHRCKHTNVAGYLLKWIEGAMKKHTAADHPRYRVPDDVMLSQMTGEPECDDTTGMIDVLDAINHACLSDADRQIVQMREAGDTFGAIAKSLCISTSTVSARLREIGERVKIYLKSD